MLAQQRAKDELVCMLEERRLDGCFARDLPLGPATQADLFLHSVGRAL